MLLPRNSALRLRFRNPFTICWSHPRWSAFSVYLPDLYYLTKKSKCREEIENDWEENRKIVCTNRQYLNHSLFFLRQIRTGTGGGGGLIPFILLHRNYSLSDTC